MKALLLVMVLVAGVQAQTQQTSKYDKFTDETTVSVRYFHPAKGLNMEALYRYRGQRSRIVPPETIDLLFVVAGPTSYRDIEAELFILSDDKRFRFIGNAQYSQAITSLTVPIPFDKFESLMAGKKIEMRLGSDDLNLSEGDIKALRDFLPQRITSKP